MGCEALCVHKICLKNSGLLPKEMPYSADWLYSLTEKSLVGIHTITKLEGTDKILNQTSMQVYVIHGYDIPNK